jgi:hypothetical protein
MPEINSYADTTNDWEGLLVATLEHLAQLPSVEAHRTALEQHLQATKAVKARQDSHTAGRQEATQELKAMIVQGRELATRLRGAIRADLGPKNERLVQFRVKPIRRRTRRTKPEEPGTDPAASPAGPDGAIKPAA